MLANISHGPIKSPTVCDPLDPARPMLRSSSVVAYTIYDLTTDEIPEEVNGMIIMHCVRDISHLHIHPSSS